MWSQGLEQVRGLGSRSPSEGKQCESESVEDHRVSECTGWGLGADAPAHVMTTGPQ